MSHFADVKVRKRPHDKHVYLCRYDRVKTSPGIVLHCGSCLTGLLLPEKGDRCRVCGAKVVDVSYGIDYREDSSNAQG